MTALLAILCIVLITIIIVQIGKVSELATKIRGEEEVQIMNNRRQAIYMLVFMVVFLLATIISGVYYKNYYLGIGVQNAASEHGSSLDRMFNITLFFTGLVFLITQVLLFYFAFKYKADKGRKALFMPHDNRLEVVWTVVPAVVMTFLVVGGLDAWNEVMADIPQDAVPKLVPATEDKSEYLEIEATGYQFAWDIRYPGADGLLGTKNFKLISGTNPLGQDWKDTKNIDDMHVQEIVLPKNRWVRVRITAKDVLHNFYLPHFRVKMDAVPGTPTYFVFKPTKTTEEYRQQLSAAPEFQQPDPNDPTRQLWETFNYELACAELCGKGHFSMRRMVRVVEEGEYQAWLGQQSSYYLSNIRGKDEDPNKDELFDFEISARKMEFNNNLDKALASANAADKTVQLSHVFFEAGSTSLKNLSKYELTNLSDGMKKYPNLRIEVAGHTDNTGDAQANQTLSERRAQAVVDFLVGQGIAADRLVARGYGQTRPIDTNDTEAGRAKNRRTEFSILAQ